MSGSDSLSNGRSEHINVSVSDIFTVEFFDCVLSVFFSLHKCQSIPSGFSTRHVDDHVLFFHLEVRKECGDVSCGCAVREASDFKRSAGVVSSHVIGEMHVCRLLGSVVRGFKATSSASSASSSSTTDGTTATR